MRTYIEYENNHFERLIDGLEWGRFSKRMFRRSVAYVVRDVRHDHAAGMMLAADSHRARLRWHRAFLHHMADALGDPLDGSGPAVSASFFTLIDARESYDDPRDRPAVVHLRHHFTLPLNGWNFVGMLEPALFVKLPDRSTRHLLAWHLHGIVWDTHRSLIDEAREIARRRGFNTLVPGMTVLKVDAIEPDGIERVVGYLNKSPRQQTALWKRGPQAKLKAYSKNATGANLVRLHRHLEGLHLDGLAVAGGEGRKVMSAIKADALNDWRSRKEGHQAGGALSYAVPARLPYLPAERYDHARRGHIGGELRP